MQPELLKIIRFEGPCKITLTSDPLTTLSPATLTDSLDQSRFTSLMSNTFTINFYKEHVLNHVILNHEYINEISVLNILHNTLMALKICITSATTRSGATGSRLSLDLSTKLSGQALVHQSTLALLETGTH